jgi:hypothetical protein
MASINWYDTWDANSCIDHTQVNDMVTHIIRPVVTKTAAYTAVDCDIILVNATGGAVTITLNAAPTLGDIIDMKKIDASANAAVLAGNGNTIDGSASISLTTQYESICVVFDGSNWHII